MKKELTVVGPDPKEFNLEVRKADVISKSFKPSIVERDVLTGMYEQLIVKEITPELCKESGDLRKKLKKVRSNITAIHRTEKSFYLAGGQFVDAWKRKSIEPIIQMEERLTELEQHYELEKEKELQELEISRLDLLKPYLTEIQKEYPPTGLSAMTDDVWENYFAGTKLGHENREAAAKQQKQEALAEQKRLEEEEIERQRINEIGWSRNSEFNDLGLKLPFLGISIPELGKMNNENYSKAFENAKVEKKKEDDRIEKIEADNKKVEKERVEREKKQSIIDKKAKESQERIDAENKQLREELEEKERADKKRIEKEETEKAQILADAEAKTQQELNQGDKARMNQLTTDLSVIKTRFSGKFKSKVNKKKFQDVEILIDKIIKHIK